MSKGKHWRDALHEHNQDWINNRDKPKEIVSKSNTQAYRNGWERIFGGNTNAKTRASTTKKSVK